MLASTFVDISEASSAMSLLLPWSVPIREAVRHYSIVHFILHALAIQHCINTFSFQTVEY
uniref:Uncharacterized protein n=1 Tax=Arundo donax TaxID=35708 RepID=A0A0A9G5B6_ARUDO